MFSTKLETVAQPNKKSDSTRLELAELGSIKENILSDIRLLEERALYYKDIDEKIEKAEKDLKELEESITDATQRQNVYDVLNAKIDESKEFQATISFQNKELLEKFDTLSAEIKVKEELLNRVQADLKSATLAYNKAVEKYDEEIEAINNDLEDRKQYQKEYIANAKKELQDWNKLIMEEDEKFVNIGVKISKLEIQLKSLEMELAEKEALAIKTMNEANEYSGRVRAEADAYFADKKLELELVSGELSQKEAWLNEKEQKLLDLKVKMEAFHGKKIDSINL